ncbi:IS4 family transposase [Calothrix sp. NIES-3974]|uniref:IS4 family transposase n=1 Tax=Calothrix sp. NIES-3974 TaxID=2005462 RepID=UPI000B5F8653|nr:IS4 family transposase [Calothrix sp. NIES-3974]BAZ03500.1 transposase [Calothrix sp. NIES-3974]BAZ04526.1 transposase [Calothrix sp. NIES-3974]BAZ04908.1 transposase [Calothrix sp. NIES-3974]BAZ05291.1 transposase [Calothrix sp. NIES-3974]BAZ05293.1 transposase [Calothrix sp. NIES-3974]
MEKWAARELKHLDLGDKRRNKRLIKMVEDLAAQPTSSVPQACGSVAATTAAYDLWSSPYIKPSDISNGHIKSTIERAKEHEIVLAIQDTTNMDVTSHPATEGIGYLDQRKSLGLKVHSTLLSSIKGVPLGVIDQQVWSRNIEDLGIAKTRRKRQTEEKESQRWLEGLERTNKLLPEKIKIITVADSEADIFDLFNQERPENSHLLIRGTHNRKVSHTANYLHEAIRSSPTQGEVEVKVRRNPERPERIAKLTIRYETVEIEVPKNKLGRSLCKPVKLQVILAEEKSPPSEIKPISWLLLTTLEINSLEDAVKCVEWYTYRWLIERYHYTLKSGCRIEELQLETGKRLSMALATYSIVAWRLLWLTYQARDNPEQSCETVLTTVEWQSLCVSVNKNPIPPDQPPTLREAVRMIARLGGFLGRKGDGEPGVKTIWRGLRRLHDIAVTWKLAHQI